jgi:hypothetical protein
MRIRLIQFDPKDRLGRFPPPPKVIDNAHAGKEECCEGEYQNKDKSRHYRFGRDPKAPSQGNEAKEQSNSDYAAAHSLVSRIVLPSASKQ